MKYTHWQLNSAQLMPVEFFHVGYICGRSNCSDLSSKFCNNPLELTNSKEYRYGIQGLTLQQLEEATIIQYDGVSPPVFYTNKQTDYYLGKELSSLFAMVHHMWLIKREPAFNKEGPWNNQNLHQMHEI